MTSHFKFIIWIDVETLVIYHDSMWYEHHFKDQFSSVTQIQYLVGKNEVETLCEVLYIKTD